MPWYARVVAFSIREATRRDAEALIAHTREMVADPERTGPLELDELARTVADERDRLEVIATMPRARIFVAEADGALIGQLVVEPVSTRRALQHVAWLGMSVKRPWRRRGVGRALMTRAIEFAEASGIKRLELYVYARNTAAIRLYEAFAFEVEGRRRAYVREGDAYIDDLVMARLFGMS